ncbi:MAG: hypothetical protein LBC67_03255 [Spirochaetales bacterium]|jgi:hypothetical protein|nr:hypothetical protein [Spirochaetales bacterium]
MKNRFILAAVCCALAALFGASCSSTPPPAEEPQDGAAAVPSLEEEIGKAEALKKSIEDYGLLAFTLPEEFEAANGELDSGREAAAVDYDKAKGLLDSASGRYQAIFDAGIGKRAASRLAEIDAAREEADSYKARKAASEDYALAAGKTDEAQRLLDAREYVEAWTVSSEALDAFIKSARAARLKRDTAQGELTRTASAQDEASTRLQSAQSETGGEQ